MWEDHQAALKEWLGVKDDLLAGRKPRDHRDGYTVADLCEDFLVERHDRGLKLRTLNEYKKSCDLLCKVFDRNRLANDLQPEDFGDLRKVIAKGRRPKTVQNEIGRISAIINFGNGNKKLVPRVETGTFFRRPSDREMRQDKAAQDHMDYMMLEANQINAVLAIASTQIKAMTLLAINVGMGNDDCAKLEIRHIDLKTGWLDYCRPKTAIQRRAKLWVETADALKLVFTERRKPTEKEHEKYVFVTKYGQTWFKEDSKTSPISHEFRKYLKATNNYTKGIGFYALRRSFETIAGGSEDQPAVDMSMGHKCSRDMAALYRQSLGDDRLINVAKKVHEWLYDDEVSE